MIVLGLKVFGHDTGAALIEDTDGDVKITAISEERLKDIIINFKAGRKFDNEIMKELISRIDVYENKKIEITFNF